MLLRNPKDVMYRHLLTVIDIHLHTLINKHYTNEDTLIGDVDLKSTVIFLTNYKFLLNVD